MKQKVIEMILKMDLKSIETQLVLQCAPFLAGLKVSNLLAIPADMENNAMDMLKKAGISFFRMIKTDKKTVILLFRKKQLENYLYRKDVKEILISEGYVKLQIGYVLYMFSTRYQDYICGKGRFPHEIGLILGYPAEDVRGFIDNNGRNFLYTGYWKVYKDVDNKVKLFEKFKIAEELLIQLFSSGMDMECIIKECSTGKMWGRYCALPYK